MAGTLVDLSWSVSSNVSFKEIQHVNSSLCLISCVHLPDNIISLISVKNISKQNRMVLFQGNKLIYNDNLDYHTFFF